MAYTNLTKNTTTFTNVSKNTTKWSSDTFFLKQEDGFNILQEDGSRILLDDQAGNAVALKSTTNWSNQTKNTT